MLTARLVQIPDTIKATESFSLMVEIIDEATGEVVEDLKWKVNLFVCLSVKQGSYFSAMQAVN